MNFQLRSENTLRYLLLPLVIFISFFYNINTVPLFDLDEGAFSEATREMLERGDFISPYLNGEPRYDKPILIYWLQAASVKLLGLNELALRLPSALFSTLWVMLIYAFVQRVRDSGSAAVAALLTASALQVSIIAKAAIADAALNFFISAALFAIFLFYRSAEKKYIYWTFAAAALGFLTKGPVALLIPLAVSLMFFALKGKFTLWLRAVLNPAALLLFVLLAAPWYVAQYLKEGQAFIDGFFLKHNLARYQSTFERHGGDFFYYIPVLLIGLLPYSSVFMKLFTRAASIVKDDLQLFLLIWFLFVVVFFSFSQTKLPHYIVYGYPAVFILMSFYIGALRSRFLTLLPPLALFAALLALPILVTHYAPLSNDAYTRAALQNAGDYFSPAYIVFFALSLLLTLYLMFERRYAITQKLLLSGAVTVLGVTLFIVPLAGQILQQPIKEAALLAKRADYTVVMWGLNTPSFSVYSERITPRRNPRPGDVVLTKSPRLAELKHYEVLYEKNGIALVRVLH